MIRSGLRELLQKQPGWTVVGEASNGRQALELARQLTPDVVVMDLSMPELNGVDATRKMLTECPGVRVIGLSANSNDRAIGEMVRAGAAGFVAKDSAFEELVSTIRAVIRGKVSFTPSVISHVLGGRAPGSNGGNPFEAMPSSYVTLSPRERETLQLIAEGKSTKEIAAILGVSSKTAETHRRNIMTKLELDSVAELTKYAIREGLTTV